MLLGLRDLLHHGLGAYLNFLGISQRLPGIATASAIARQHQKQAHLPAKWLQHGEDREFLRRVAGIGKLAVSAEAALRIAIHEGGTNLSSQSRFPRRIRDHVVVLDRYPDVRSQFHLRPPTP